MKTKGSILGATMLITGTCIGGGILALPVATGEAGFIPSMVMMLVGWAFMTITALFLAEVSLWMDEGAHVISMASRFLGPLGKGVAWVLYLFIAYASLIAYAAGGGELLTSGVNALLGYALPEPFAITLFVIFFGSILYLGNVFLGRVNTLLMMGLILSYVLLIGTGASLVDGALLLRRSWGNTLIAVPLLLTIFSFQTIVPSLTIYLKKDAKALRLSIILGTTIALVIYLLWEWLILGTVLLDGEYGLARALLEGKPATEYLGVSVGRSWLGLTADLFAFFALITSFLGIALGLFDFLADGFKIKKTRLGSFTLGLSVALPVIVCAITLERVFLVALDMTGGFGDAVLNGLLPALMLYSGRYRHQLQSEYRTPGGKPLIGVIILYALFVFTIEVLGKVGVITAL